MLHMPEEREQRIHYVRFRCSLRLSGVETAGRWVGVGVHAPWSSGSEKCRVLVFVLGVLFEEQGSCLHVCFLWHNLVSQHTFG